MDRTAFVEVVRPLAQTAMRGFVVDPEQGWRTMLPLFIEIRDAALSVDARLRGQVPEAGLEEAFYTVRVLLVQVDLAVAGVLNSFPEDDVDHAQRLGACQAEIVNLWETLSPGERQH